MMKMQIALDENRAKKAGIDLNSVYEEIDKLFAGVQATKEVLSDGTVEYTNNQNRPEQALSDMGIVLIKLRQNAEFAKCCKKWLWLESLNDKNKEFGVGNILKDEMRENILFAR